MPPNKTRIAAIFARAKSADSATVVYSSQTATGLKGSVSGEAAYQLQGFKENYKFSVWIISTGFTTWPNSGDSVRVDGTVYRALLVTQDDRSGLYRIDLGERYAGL